MTFRAGCNFALWPWEPPHRQRNAAACGLEYHIVLLEDTNNILLTAASFRGLQTFAGPLGQQSIIGWPSGLAINIWLALWASNQYLDGPLLPATDSLRPEAIHDLLLPMATTF